jgi:membrane associated rhomboid family serine protease
MLVSSWVERVEDHFGHWAVPNLVRVLVGLNIATYLFNLVSPGFIDILTLQPEAVMHGEVWRVVTFLFIPPVDLHPIFLLLFFWFLWWVGDALEGEIGSFQVNLFYLVSLLAVGAATPFIGLAVVPNVYLHTAIFLMFGTLFPEVQILLMMVIPTPAKILAWISAAWTGLQFFLVPEIRLVIAASMAGYLAFFGEALVRWMLRK